MKKNIKNKPINLLEIAQAVDIELKTKTVGMVVAMFRNSKKMSLLNEVIPMLSVGNKRALNDVLNKVVEHVYIKEVQNSYMLHIEETG